ncbi:MAG TPA: helix-turn-helix domain-containing protein [Candidatus Paceibacterota bacterium]
MRVEIILEKLGFSANEVKVYLASLESGIASAQDIAKKAGLRRTTAYSVLSYLVERGVVGRTKVKNKTRFLAEPPDRLFNLVSELQSHIKKALPELEALYNKNETKPKIIFFEGENAIHNVYEDTLKERPKEILEWNTDLYFDRFPKNYNYIDKRVSLGITARRIAGSGSLWEREHKPFDQSELADTRVVPRDSFWPEIEVNIYNNKTAFMNYAENMSVIIESKAIADAMRQAYELSWLGAQILANK